MSVLMVLAVCLIPGCAVVNYVFDRYSTSSVEASARQEQKVWG